MDPINELPILEADEDLGPAMLALNERQRRFVRCFIAFPTANNTQLARMAGYDHRTRNSMWQKGHRLSHDPAIIAAIQEELAKTFHAKGAAVAQRVMFKIAANDRHPAQLKAAMALADRGGFGAVSEQRISVEKTDHTGKAMVERIKVLARQLGLDPATLLGGPVKQIELKATSPDAPAAVAADTDRGTSTADPALRGVPGSLTDR